MHGPTNPKCRYYFAYLFRLYANCYLESTVSSTNKGQGAIRYCRTEIQISERVHNWQDIFNLGMARMKLMVECNLRSALTTAAVKLFKFIDLRNYFFF
jgi:hypothetical protein